MSDKLDRDNVDRQWERVCDFNENPEKYTVIDGIDCSGYESEVGIIVSFAPGFLSDSVDAIHLRKVLRKKVGNLDIEGWRCSFGVNGSTISAGHWLSVLSSITLFLEDYDSYVEKNKGWLGASFRDQEQAMNKVDNKVAALVHALNNPNLPDMPNLSGLFCGESSAAEPLNKEGFQDGLNRFGFFLEEKKIEFKGTSTKGCRYERQLAKKLLEILHTNLFREKVRPITLIMLIINVRYNKKYNVETITGWLNRHK